MRFKFAMHSWLTSVQGHHTYLYQCTSTFNHTTCKVMSLEVKLDLPISIVPFLHELLLSRSSLETLISLDLFSTKLYCFRARIYCYYCLYIIFSANPVRHSEELHGGP